MLREEELWSLLAKKHSHEASPAELELLDKLIEENQLSQAALSDLEKMWKAPLLSQLEREAEAPQNIVLPPSRTAYRPWMGYAAAVILLLSISFLIRSRFSADSSPQRVADVQLMTTSLRPKMKEVLPDGSIIWLNKNSSIVYDKTTFAKENRNLKLLGEAFFEVTKHPDLPFIVSTSGNTNIEVRGTAFNVKAYHGIPVEATLIRGAIIAYDKSRPENRIELKPNEKITVVAEKQKELKFVLNGLPDVPQGGLKETSWVANKLSFDNQSFAELVPRFQKWFDIRIHIDDRALLAYRFTGEIEYETLAETLDAMKLSAPFTYTIKNNEVWIDLID